MATYKQIRDDVKRFHGRSVKNCWIAHVKELNGLNPHPAHNRVSANSRQYPCPDKFREMIEQSMKRLGVFDRA